MSYTVAFYLGEMNLLKSVIGSNDISFVKQSDYCDEETDIGKAMIDLIHGDSHKLKKFWKYPEIVSTYGYALEKIIEAIGFERIFISAFEDLHYSEFEGPLEWIENSGAPIDLPPSDDYPFIGHIYLSKIKECLEAWDDDILNEYEPDTQSLIEGMLELFDQAAKKEKDVISFYY